MKIFHKCYIGLVSAWKILCVKICTRGKARATWINSIRGALKIEIIGDGSITIGHRLMSRGPLYLKSVDGGNCILVKVYFLIIIALLLVQKAL